MLQGDWSSDVCSSDLAGDENTADLVALRLRIDGDRLRASFELNTMFQPQDAIAALAVDTDDDASTGGGDRKSTRLNSSHLVSSYAVFWLKKKRKENTL